jgi:flagellar hook-length control protein FliK
VSIAPPIAPSLGPDKGQAAQGKGKTASRGGFQSLLQSILGGLRKNGSAESGKKTAQAAAGQAKALPKKVETPHNASPEKAQSLDRQGIGTLFAKGRANAPIDSGSPSAPGPNQAISNQKGKKAKGQGDDPASSETQASMASHAALLSGNTLANRQKPDNSAKAEKSDEAKIADSPKKDKANGKPRIDLIDNRKTEGRAGGTEPADSAARDAEGKKGAKEGAMTLDLTAHSARGQDDSGMNEASGKPGESASFSSRLAQRLQESANADIVRHSTVILNEGDSGIIRLNLKPEALGNVKVRLDLADNNITGTIIVESEAAREAFEADLEHLAKSFIDSGFQDAKLSVSVDSGSSGARGRQDGRDNPQAFARAAQALDKAVPLADSPLSGSRAAARDSGYVNIVV